MGHRWRADDDRVHLLDGEGLTQVIRQRDARKSCCDLVEPALPLIADECDLCVRQVLQDSHIVDAPVTASEHRDASGVRHELDAGSIHLGDSYPAPRPPITAGIVSSRIFASSQIDWLRT